MENGNISTNSGGTAADHILFANQPDTSQPDGTATVSHSTPQVDSPSSSTPLTVENVKAAIPEHGIKLDGLFMLFKPNKQGGKAVYDFCEFLHQSGRCDPATGLVMPKMEAHTPPGNISATTQPSVTAPPTKDQVKAAIPEHGITFEELAKLFKPWKADMPVHHFAKLAKQSGKYDPATQLFTPKKKSKASRNNTSATIQPDGTAAMFHSDTQADGLAPSTLPTLEEIQAAIPEQGIALRDLFRLFKHRLIGNEGRSHFVGLARKIGKLDLATDMIFPIKETESLVESKT